MRQWSGYLLGFCLLLGGCGEAYAATLANAGGSTAIAGLGATSFATSTKSADAQEAFLRGLLLLHLFEYADAKKAFLAAETLDDTFAMAYWGEAMTYNHGVWDRVDEAGGKAALDKYAPSAEARAQRIGDAREKAYMGAVELLYDGKGTKAERDARYTKAMEGVAKSFPDDRNGQLFYALALIGQCEGVRDVPVYLKAAAIAQGIYRLEPQNPGAAHYWIHGMDDPEHAAGALEAARALSKIAPDAPHAQHMCSHIFIALGMWDDVVQANVDAMRVSNRLDKAEGLPVYNCDHYPSWLEYGYFQQGRMKAAEATVAACRQTDVDSMAYASAHPEKYPGGSDQAMGMHHHLMEAGVEMQCMEVIELGNWKKPTAPVDVSMVGPDTAAWWDFVLGFAAAERGDLASARSSLGSMRAAAAEAAKAKGMGPEHTQALELGLQELDGLIQVKTGNYVAGVKILRGASATYAGMAFAFGPPITFKPPQELLGEVLLAEGDAGGARRAFEESLKLAPKRTLSLLGLARAEKAAGDIAAARGTYGELAAIWHGADADAPGVREARAGR